MISCGIFGSFWSPLSNWGRSGADGVSNPFTALLLFQVGQIITLPFLLSIHANYIDETSVSPLKYVKDAWHLDSRDQFFCVFSGVFVGVGYFLYFVTSDSISPTVALGIASCEPLTTIIIAAIANFEQLKHSSYNYKLYMAVSTIFFIVAIGFMTSSSYYSNK
jgi:drug/metabolite transporter (DMT)-like permease